MDSLRKNYFESKCEKAPWQPADPYFGYIWSALYIGYFVLLFSTRNDTEVFPYLILGLVLNLAWIPIYKYSSKLGFILIVAMIGVTFYAKSKVTNINQDNFLVAYLIWLFFALSLNGYTVLHCKY